MTSKVSTTVSWNVGRWLNSLLVSYMNRSIDAVNKKFIVNSFCTCWSTCEQLMSTNFHEFLSRLLVRISAKSQLFVPKDVKNIVTKQNFLPISRSDFSWHIVCCLQLYDCTSERLFFGLIVGSDEVVDFHFVVVNSRVFFITLVLCWWW